MNMGDYRGAHLVFDVMLNLAILVSISVVYWREIREMLSDAMEYLHSRGDSVTGEAIILKPSARMLLFILIGTLPMFLVLIFSGSIARLFLNTIFVGFAICVTGALLLVSDKYIKRGNKTEKTMQLSDAIIIGLAQCVAAIPGMSRSGTTITVGLARGFSAGFAVKFSLLLLIPAVLGSFFVSLYRVIANDTDFSMFGAYFAGFVIAAVVGFFVIQFLRRLLQKGGFGYIPFYCFIVGGLTMIISLIF